MCLWVCIGFCTYLFAQFVSQCIGHHGLTSAWCPVEQYDHTHSISYGIIETHPLTTTFVRIKITDSIKDEGLVFLTQHHLWCNDDVMMMLWWCNDDVIMMLRWCNDGVTDHVKLRLWEVEMRTLYYLGELGVKSNAKVQHTTINLHLPINQQITIKPVGVMCWPLH